MHSHAQITAKMIAKNDSAERQALNAYDWTERALKHGAVEALDTPGGPQKGLTAVLRALAAHEPGAWKNTDILPGLPLIARQAVVDALPFDEEGAKKALEYAVMRGETPPESGKHGIVLRAAEQGRSMLYLPLPKNAQGTLVSILLELGELPSWRLQCRLSIDGQEDEQLIRFHAEALTFNLRQRLEVSMADRTRLLQVACDAGQVAVYVDGLLIYWSAREAGRLPDGLILDLTSDAGKEYTAVLHGLQICALNGQGATPPEAMQDWARERMKDALASDDIKRVSSLLHALSPLDLTQLADDIQGFIERIRAREPRLLSEYSWLVEGLASSTNPQQADVLRANAARDIPHASLEVRAVMAEYSSNPIKQKSLWSLMKRSQPKYFQVLNGIEFSLYPGDVLGVIGSNGAGKSTLLRAINGNVRLSGGQISAMGDALLLRPGVGMREELTGRENIVSGGIFLGLSMRAIRAKMDAIIEFSELGEAIDRPYKYYSDGMKARLIFSIATSVEPDILMLDELLGAGDVTFQKKATARMDSMLEHAKTVILVQHSVEMMKQRCNKALYIRKGKQLYFGDPEIATEMYLCLG